MSCTLPDVPPPPPRWMTRVLIGAGLYNLAWGSVSVIAPRPMLSWCGFDPLPTYPGIWQGMGMLLALFGVGYLIAAANPARHWAIVFIGLLSKVIGSLGYLGAAAQGEMPWSFAPMLLINDVIWWWPFAMILGYAADTHAWHDRALARALPDVLSEMKTTAGQTLANLNEKSPLLLVMLRHSGCTFCREALAGLAADRAAVEAEGVQIVVGFQSAEADFQPLLATAGLEDVASVADLDHHLYRALNVPLAPINRLLSWRVWWRGFQSAILEGRGFGRVRGDVRRMSGTFLLKDGTVVRADHPESPADHPQYAELVREGLRNPVPVPMTASSSRMPNQHLALRRRSESPGAALIDHTINRFRELLSLIRFSHTIFALPFALFAAALAWQREPFQARHLLGILVCMVFARSAAMAFNRLADRHLDASNPRTAGRHLPAGTLSVRLVVAFTVICSAGFVFSTLLFLPNRLPILLSLPVLGVLFGYSYAKRWTSLCHYWLAAALMLSPIAVWIALVGTVEWPPVILGLVILFWVGGFDIIYACQDTESDRQAGLFSLPARIGIGPSLKVAMLSHMLTIVGLVALWHVAGLGVLFLLGVVAVAALLVYEHRLVRPDDLTRVNVAFFHINAVISLGLLVVGLIDLWLPF